MSISFILDNENKYWDKLISNSSHGTIFSLSSHLNFYKNKFEVLKYVFFDEKNINAIACVPIILGDETPLFNVYNGIIFNQETLEIKNNSRRYSKILNYSEKIISLIAKKHQNIHLTLNPKFEDLRAFQWHNYHEKLKPKFKIELRNTGILELKNINKDQILEKFRTVRRREFKRFSHLVTTDGEVDDLIALYKKTFNRQDIKINDNFLINLFNYCNYAMKKKFARINFLKDLNGNFVSASLFIFDDKNAYYLIGASDPELRKEFPSSPAIAEQILYFHEKKLNIDMLGVNSPQRGDFKLSFSPKMVKYFNVYL